MAAYHILINIRATRFFILSGKESEVVPVTPFVSIKRREGDGRKEAFSGSEL